MKTGRFTKGKSGNPKGRPKGSWSVPDAVRRFADKIGRDTVVKRLYENHFPLFMAYGWGNPPETHINLTDQAVDPKALAIARELAKERLQSNGSSSVKA